MNDIMTEETHQERVVTTKTERLGLRVVGRPSYWDRHSAEMLARARALVLEGLGDRRICNLLHEEFPNVFPISRTPVKTLRLAMGNPAARSKIGRPRGRGSRAERTSRRVRIAMLAAAQRYIRESYSNDEVMGRLCKDFPDSVVLDTTVIGQVRAKLSASADGTNRGRITIWSLRPDVTQFAGALVPYLSASQISREIRARFSLDVSVPVVTYLKSGIIKGSWIISEEAKKAAAAYMKDRKAKESDTKQTQHAAPVQAEARGPQELGETLFLATYDDLVECKFRGVLRLSRPGCYQFQLRRIGSSTSLYETGPSHCENDDMPSTQLNHCCNCPNFLSRADLNRLKEARLEGFQFPRSAK